MSQITNWVIESHVLEPLAPPMRNDVIYCYGVIDLTVGIVPLAKTHTATQRRHNQDAVARRRKPGEEIITQTFSLSTQWRVFQHNFEGISRREQHQIFGIWAAIAPEHSGRTDAEWRNSIRRLPSTETNCLSPLLLRLSFEALHTSCTAPHLLHDPKLLQRSANDNLAELRKLLGATEDLSCNVLALEDRIVRALPIGFVKEVYKSLPFALIDHLPCETVFRALSMIDKMAPDMRKPENKFRVLLWQCAVSQEDSTSFRNWMASGEGKLRYLQAKDGLGQLLSKEEFDLCLTTVRCYEMVLADDNWWGDRHYDPKSEEGTWEDALKAHLNGSAQIPRPNLWQVVGSSFKRAYNRTYPSTALLWLDAVLDDEPSSDGLIQTLWESRLREASSALPREASYDALGSQSMQRQVSQRGYC